MNQTKKQKNNIELIINPKKYIRDKKIIRELTSIARDGFGTEITDEDVKNHVLETDILYIISDKDNGEYKGFSSYDILPNNGKAILYLSGIVVKREFQKEGIFYEVNKKALELTDFDCIAMRTQSPVIYAATEKIVKEIYPRNNHIPQEVKEIAEIIAKEHLNMSDFDTETFVGRKTYGVCLYDKIPRHERADPYFDEILKMNYDEGDSMIIIGRLK